MNTDDAARLLVSLSEVAAPPNEIININEDSTSSNKIVSWIEPSQSINAGGAIRVKAKTTIFNLPQALFYVLFGDWLFMTEIIRYERAIKFSKQHKQSFYEQLNGCPITIDSNITKKLNLVQILEWIKLRSVRYKCIKISRWNSSLSTDILEYFNKKESNKQMENLVIDANASGKKISCIEDEFSPMNFLRYCIALVDLKKIYLIGRNRKQSDNLDNFDQLVQTIVQNNYYNLEEVMFCRSSVSLFSLNTVAEFCPKLKKLCLKNCSGVNSTLSLPKNFSCFSVESFRNFVVLLHLIEIDLSYSAVESGAITYILNNCCNLTKILLARILFQRSLNLIPSSCYRNIERNNLKLLEVDISHNGNDSDDVCALLKKTPKLTKFLAMNNNFIDSVAISLSDNCTNLTALNIAMSNKQLTGGGFIIITERCRKLKVIDISECFNITDACLCAIFVNCIDLETISMNKCINISNIGVQNFLKQCLKLKAIYIDSCLNLTNESFMNINKTLTNIKSISFRNCYQIEEEGVLSLIDICPKNMINFWCDKNMLTPRVVEEMKKKFIKNIKKLTLCKLNY